MGPNYDRTWQTGKEFWFQALTEGWYDLETMAEGSYSTLAQRVQWRRDDVQFDRAWADCEDDEEARVIDLVRLRALEGDRHALRLCHRTLRGAAKPEKARPGQQRDDGPKDPKVAAAMIRAGILASGAEIPELPERRPPVNMRPPGYNEQPYQSKEPWIPAHAERARELQRQARRNSR